MGMWCLSWLVCSGLLWAQGGLARGLPRVEPGVEYLHHRIGDGPWSIHVVKVDRSAARFRLVNALAQDRVFGLASVSEQVQGLCPGEGRPVAAVNGDFFVIRPGPYQGDPRGLHIVQGELVSSPAGASLWLDTEGRPHLGSVRTAFRAAGPGGWDLAFGLNEARGEDKAVLYTPAVGPSTRTGPGLELVLERAGEGDWLPLRAGRNYRAKVTAIREQGDVPLRPEIMVLSIGAQLAGTLPAVELGMVVSLHLRTSPDLAGAVTALGGGPILLDGGEAPQWQPPQPRHPRTAIGWNEGHFFLVVVDGRQEGFSVGMTYPEVAALMRRLGCTHAMNLDGGGSSTLWLDGHIMNSPSDGRERRVANSLIVVSLESNRDAQGRQDR
jgi:large repetitive protein